MGNAIFRLMRTIKVYFRLGAAGMPSLVAAAEESPGTATPVSQIPTVPNTHQKLYDDLRTELHKRQMSNSENFDKAILAYASGGLAFSLGFLKDFIPISQAWAPWLLKGSWGLFVIAIVAVICSYLVSQRGITKQLDIAKRYYLDGDQYAFSEINSFGNLTNCLNETAGISFIIAISITTIFVAANLERASTVNEHNKTSKLTYDGAPMPTMQQAPGSILQKGQPIPAMQQVPVRPATTQQPAQAPQPAQTPQTGGSTQK